MALTPLLRAVACAYARDFIANTIIAEEIQRAAETGPWAYSPEEVAEMWAEMTERGEDMCARLDSLKAIYDPWIVHDVMGKAAEIIICELS